MSLFLLLSGCSNTGNAKVYYKIHFETNTDIETNFVADQNVKKGMHAKKPNCIALDDDKQNYIVFDWYTDKELNEVWNFKKDYPTSNMTLYAKWGYQYDVNYYLGDSEKPYQTKTVRDGTIVKEDVSAAVGYEYYGSYEDKDYTTPFDFTKPITHDTNIYIKRSDGLMLYEENKTGSLSSLLTPFKASWTDAKPAKIGSVSTIKLNDNKEYTYVNFGSSIYYADPYVEFNTHVDITKSQILRFKIKNLGPATRLTLYFTTMIDLEDETYSATSRFYNEGYVIYYTFKENEKNMDENDEWLTIDFDLTTVGIHNGYAVWGGSSYLGAIRIQANYISKSAEDLSNNMIIKSIEGIYKEYEVKDSSAISEKLEDDDTTEVKQISDEQKENNGFIFPKNASLVKKESTYATTYTKKDGLLLYTENETKFFDTDYLRSMVSISKPENDTNKTDLAEYCTLNIELENYGYQDNITLYIHNDIGDLIITSLDIDTNMNKAKTYTLNLYKYEEMAENLTSIDILYTATGIDNALLIKSIYFTVFAKDDVPGINFSDKYCLNLESNDDVSVSYNRNRAMTKFDVKSENVTLDNFLNYELSNKYYQYINLSFVYLSNSKHKSFDIVLLVNDEYQTYTFDIDTSITGKAQTITLDLKKEKGIVSYFAIKFKETGTIYFNKLTFSFDEDDPHNISFNHPLANTLTHSDWVKGSIRQDSNMEANILTPNSDGKMLFRLYVGYIVENTMTCDYYIENPTLEGKSKVTLIYRNPNKEAVELKFGFAISKTEYGTGDDGLGYLEDSFSLPSNNDYEWSAISLDIPENYQSYRLAKLVLEFDNAPLYIRALIVE